MWSFYFTSLSPKVPRKLGYQTFLKYEEILKEGYYAKLTF